MSIKKKGVVRLQKQHNKVRFVSKVYTNVNSHFYKKLYGNIRATTKKTRRWLFRVLARKRLVINYRLVILNKLRGLLTLEDLTNINFNPLTFFFYRFKYPVINSLEYYLLTDKQIEMIRRLARKLFGKNVFIRVLVKAYKVLLRRTNLVRMGGGKGVKIYKTVFPIVPGNSIIEFRGLTSSLFIYRFVTILMKKFSLSLKVVFYNRI